jgi:hypothetical protein
MWRFDPKFGRVWPVEDGEPTPLNESAFFTTDAAAPPPRCTKFVPLQKASLLGFATIEFASGVVMSDISIHQNGSRCWASPPAKPMLDKDGVAVRESNGKVKYNAVVRFSDPSIQRKWSEQVLFAVRDAFPDAIPETEADPARWARRRS